jgi:nucleotide-binding universal stress UspA family protein
MSVVVGRDPADAIVHRAAELGRSTVCLATRGRGRLTGALLGSVARSVLQRADGPVVALGPLADNPGRIPPPRSWPEPLSVPRIVACVDGTPDAEQIVPLAARWAGWLGMSLSLLTIVVDSLGTGTHKHDASRFGPDGDPECYLDGLVEQCRVSTALVDAEVFTDPVGLISGIRTYLDRRPAGLLALATRARMGGDRIRGGATAAAIVHASVAPCLVVHISDGSGAGRVDTAV